MTGLYARVDSITRNILEGPKLPPKLLGNITNPKEDDLNSSGWYKYISTTFDNETHKRVGFEFNGINVIDIIEPLTQEDLSEKFENQKQLYILKVQNHLDTTAQSRGYDNIFTLCTYINSTNSTFQAEGSAGVTWRDNVWTYCYQVLSDVENSLRPAPTVEELINELPTINW